MCGIVAVHDLGGAHPPAELGRRMLDRLVHRGPDGRGERLAGPTWLGHNRLTIVDLATGAQPMPGPEGSWLVGNGEVYNHGELRARLDFGFATGSDNEAVLAALAEDGPAGVADLVGMFAFVSADADGRVVAARDSVGIKPLYWARAGSLLLFASEIKAFEPEHRALVEEFPPGCWWTPGTGLVRYAVPPTEPDAPPFADREQAKAAIRDGLVEAVRRRMMADVEVGVFLSGGLDSSLVAAVMVELAEPGQVVHSFAAGTAGSPDLAAAREVAEHLGLEHRERVYDAAEVAASLPAVIGSLESAEPSLVRSAVPNYLLAELAAEHVKVVLTGEGADELFAGYHHYRELDGTEELAAELSRDVAGLHNLNLQRCDRVTMAHGLEARVPFLDLDLVEVAGRVPIAWRAPGEVGQEKAILREAFRGWLPERLLWRVKEQFGDGSGTTAVIAEHAQALAPEPDWRAARVNGFPVPRTREELGYQRILHRSLAGLQSTRVLGRFATA